MDGNRIIISAGSVFVITSPSGDIHSRSEEGLYAHDTRFLSLFCVTLQGRPLDAVGSNIYNHSLASFYCTNQGIKGLPSGSISVVRDRYVGEGLHEDIHIANHSREPHRILLQLTFDADFADVFQVRLGHIRKAGTITVERRDGQDLALMYRRGRFQRETWIVFSRRPTIQGKVATFDMVLAPKETWKTCVTVLPVVDSPPTPMKCVETILEAPFGPSLKREQVPLGILRSPQEPRPLDAAPRLETDHEGLRLAYQEAVADLQTLRIKHESGHHILAAGLPWFMAVFGRDSIISAIQTKLIDPSLMVGTLHILASLQAKKRDPFREAEPGKILHEVRAGELSIMEEVPHSCYYGTIDATPLFLRLLWEAFQWTGDVDLVRRMLPAAEAALRWIDRHGDRDGDGFVEYKRRTRQGLRNQGWKDSGDSVCFADGRLAQGPIALVEVQGYVYDAKRKMAEVYKALGESRKAHLLEQEAEKLRRRFEEAFWMPEEGFYAMALDGQKRQVNSITSNPGHCLWSGIIDPQRASKVVERLMSPDMFSGWGIRTLSTEMARYQPLSYQNGSVWPHDNSLIAAGMARYGFGTEARQIALAIIDAAVALPFHRLPELFAGYARREYSVPVPYKTANTPQAWASGAIIYLLETLLGVLAAGDRLLHEAPREGLSLSLIGVLYRGIRRVL